MKAKIFVAFLLSYLAGATLAPLFSISSLALMQLAGIFCAMGLFMRKTRVAFVAFICLAMFLSAVSNYTHRANYLETMATRYQDKKAKIVAKIIDVPASNSFGNQVKASIVSVNEEKVSAKVNLFLPRYPKLNYGEMIEFEGKITGFSENRGRFLKSSQVGSINVYNLEVIGRNNTKDLKYYLFVLRERFNEQISKQLPAGEASLAQGLILGERSVFTDDFKQSLKNSGTTHIIALSGYNITIIMSLFILFRKYLSRLMNLLVPLALISIFIIMTGAAASIVRAGIMGVMPILARFLGRGSQSLIAVILSAVIMIMFNPFILLYDIGFQLSFAAIIGVIYIAPKLSFGSFLPWGFDSILHETIAAQLATLPILIFYFKSISLVSPLANLAILWLVPAAMLMSFMVGVFGLFSGFLGLFVALPAAALLGLINFLIKFFGELPFAAKSFEITNPIWVFIYYLLIFDIFFFFKKGKRPRPT